MPDPALDMAIRVIAEFEGFSAVPYQDQVGVWTIGFGFTYTPDMKPVTALTPHMTQAEARVRMGAIISKTLTAVRAMVYVPITDHQTAALASLVYNEGERAIRDSSLMIALNQRKYEEAADAFRSWVYAGARVNKGLVRRRDRERTLFLTPDVEQTSDDLNAIELAKHQ